MATITWRNLTAPQLQTNFEDKSLKGFTDLLSGLAQQNQFAKEKEIKDTTEALKSSFFNYTGKEGEDALNTLRSSGQFGEMLGALGNKVDQNAVREALLGTQTRLGQENQRAQLQTERDRLLAQKPYVDAVDLLTAQGDTEGAKAYLTGLTQQNVLDTDFAAKAFGSLSSAENALQDRTTKIALDTLRLENAKREQEVLKRKEQEASQVEQFTRSILTGEPLPTSAAIQAPVEPVSTLDKGLEEGRKKGVVPAPIVGLPPVPATNSDSFIVGKGGKPTKSTEPIVIPPNVTFTPPRVAVQSKTPIDRNATTVQATILSVLDGDTLDVKTIKGDEFRCRVDLINAPETAKDFAGKAGAKGGEEAAAKLRELTKEGKATVTVTNGQQKDAYGRNICMIEVSGNDVGLEMVKQGAAYLYKNYGNPGPYKEASELAKQQRLGVYAPSPQEIQQDAQKARLQEVLKNPNTPKPVFDAAVKLAEQLEKSKLAASQEDVNIKANALAIREEQNKTELAREGLSGQTIGKNPELLTDRLKNYGIKADATRVTWGADKADQYENIIEVINSKPAYKDVDASIVLNFLEQSLVTPRKGEAFSNDPTSSMFVWQWDDAYAKRLKERLDEYVASPKFEQHRNLIKSASSTTAKLQQELREARERDLRVKPK